MLLPNYAIEVSNLKDRLEAGEINTEEYNTLYDDLISRFDELEARQNAKEDADLINTMGRLFDAVGAYFTDTWEAEEEDYYLSQYEDYTSNL